MHAVLLALVSLLERLDLNMKVEQEQHCDHGAHCNTRTEGTSSSQFQMIATTTKIVFWFVVFVFTT
jgi:hypothetical protein